MATVEALTISHEALIRRVEALERRKRGPRDADDRAVMATFWRSLDRLQAATGERADRWTARAVIVLARRHDGELLAALEAADALSSKSLGKLFARCEGIVIDGWYIERCGSIGGTAVWRVKSVLSV
jgi:hypothetical protein